MLSIELLRRQRLLQGLDDPVLSWLGRCTRFREFQKRDPIIRKGDKADSLLMVLSGRLQVVVPSDDGREVGLNFIDAGDYTGELGILDGKPRSASIIATMPSVVAFIPRAEALRLITQHPMIAERVMTRLCQMVRQLNEVRSSQGMTRAFPRVYSILLNTARKVDPKTAVIENLPNQEAIAIMANVRRETVSRAIAALVDNGVVQKDARRLIVRDPGFLEKLARGEIEIRVVHRGVLPQLAKTVAAPASDPEEQTPPREALSQTS